MAKKEKKNPEDLFTSGFDIEDENKNNDGDDNDDYKSPFDDTHTNNNNTTINTTNSLKQEKVKSVEPVDVNDDLISKVESASSDVLYFEYEKQYDELTELSKKIILINDDFENQSARDIAKKMTTLKSSIENARKQWNEPHQKKIDDNNENAKKITEPIIKEVERLKQSISFYETEKERKRVEEENRLKEELRLKQEKEKQENERKSKIRSEIERLRIDGQNRVNNCNTVKDITDLEIKLNGWKLKPEFFMEFIGDAEKIKSEIIEALQKRKPIIIELEEKKQEAEKLKGKQAEQAKREAEAKQKELEAQNKLREEKQRNKQLQEQNMELAARQELIALVASFGIKYNIEGYMDSIISKYGNCRLAINNREQIIEDYRQYLKDKAEISAVKSDKVKNVRTDFLFSIVDENLIPKEFMSVDESKIRKAIQENRGLLEKDINGYKIEGLIIYPQKKTIIK